MKTQQLKCERDPVLVRETKKKRKKLSQKFATQTNPSICGNCEALDFKYFLGLSWQFQAALKKTTSKPPFSISLPQNMVVFFFNLSRQKQLSAKNSFACQMSLYVLLTSRFSYFKQQK